MKKAVIIAALAILIIGSAAYGVWLYLNRVTGIPTVPAQVKKIAVGKNDKVLIIAPHPDDETLGPGGFAQQAADAGAAVKAVVVTTGDGYQHAVQVNLKIKNPKPADYRALAEMRHKESVAAMGIVGVSDVVFLGYADGSINSLWRVSWDYSQLHTGLNGADKSPYEFAYEPGAPYCGENLVKNLSSIMKDFQPTVIIYPGPEDLHHDHWAVNAFTQYALTKDSVKAREYTYLVHRGKLWPSPPVYKPDKVMDPPYQLGEMDATWMRHLLTGVEQDTKLRAIEAYKTQMPLADQFLKAFVRQNELYAVYPDLTLGEVKNMPDTLALTKLPGVVIDDYEALALSEKLGGVGDIRRIAAVTNDKLVDIIVETGRPLEKTTVLMINLRIFTPAGIKRMDLKVYDGQVSAVSAAANSLQPEGLIVRQKDKRTVVQMSGLDFGDVGTVMLNADTFNTKETEDQWLDRTAWRRLKLN